MPGLGRLPSTDQRNAAYLMHRTLTPAEVVSPLTSKTWAFTGKVLDQGETGTCTGHAGAHAIHCSPIPHAGFINPFDLYREAVLMDEYPDNDADATELNDSKLQAGSSGTGVAKALSKRGLLVSYLWAQRFEDAINWVLSRGPVMIGSNWYSSMFTPTKEGLLKITTTASVAGGHEWLLRGVDKKAAVALMVNSWGAGWNSKATGKWDGGKVPVGHAIIDFTTLARLFHEDGDAVSIIEK